VEGWALAGGFELLLASDLIVAGESAQFGVPEVKRALVAAGGGALLLPKRVPFAIGLELVLTGEPITAARAAEVGLVNRVVPDGQALATALELAETIAENAPLALMASKQIARAAQDWTFDEGWERQLEIVTPVFTSDDAREGSAAFAERRKPKWTGR
jgi:enoyl-CoA hydratase